MNLSKLFELQRKLDEHIEREHPRQDGEDRLAKKILALLVELGELANEWKMFKYWKVNPKSNVSKFTTCSNEEAEHYFCVTCHHNYSVEKAVDMDFVCPTDDNDLMPMKQVNPMLEEYVDCLHFILSIGLETGKYKEVEFQALYADEQDIVMQFNVLFDKVGDFYAYRTKGNYQIVLSLFLALGEMLGFTWSQVEEAYMRKNAVNHQRQENGY